MTKITSSAPQQTQNNLNKSQRALNTAIERLSSGQRINSARDDAAGLAITNRMTAQIEGQQQASRNVNDGISMAQTAEGALDELNARLLRIRELTVQGISGTLTLEDSDKIQGEINQNLKEIDRLTSQSQYNDIPLLDGSVGMVGLQIGANDGETLDIDLAPPGFSVNELGLEDFTIAGIDGEVTPTSTLSGTAYDIEWSPSDIYASNGQTLNSPELVRINGANYVKALGDDGQNIFYPASYSAHAETATSSSTVSIRANISGQLYAPVESVNNIQLADAEVSYQTLDGADIANATLTKTGSQYYIQTVDTNGDKVYYAASVSTYTEIVESEETVVTDGVSETQTVTSEIDHIDIKATTTSPRYEPEYTVVDTVSGSSTVTLDPRNVTVNYTDADGQTYNDVLTTGEDGNYIFHINDLENATLVRQSDNSYLIKTETSGANEVILYHRLAFSASTDANDDHTVVTISEVGEEIRLRQPSDPLATLDRAIARVDDKRSQLGSTNNRLSAIIDSHAISSTSLAEARSRITDADYAVEVSNMTTAKILQQAGTSVLAQANQTTQSVLTLLQ